MNFLQDETLCYILGLIWADGFVSKKKYTTQLTISSKDFKNIDKIFSKSKIKYSISHRERFLKKTGKYYKSSTIYILDKEFRKFLVENLYAEKSNSSPELILNEMPIENKKHFLRGYIDGDGSFSIYNNEKTVKFNITSSLEQNWEFIENVFKLIGVEKYKIYRYKRKNGNSSSISVSNKCDIVKIGEFVYSECGEIKLERKYLKYSKIKDCNIKKSKPKWTKENDNFLLKNYYSKGLNYCCENLNRSKQSIYGRIHILNS